MSVLLQFDLQDRLAKSLRVANVSVQEMADYLGVGRNTVGNYLAGRTRPSRSALIAIALRCGVPLEWLEHGTMPSDGPDDGGGWAPRGSNPEPAVYELSQRRCNVPTARLVA